MICVLSRTTKYAYFPACPLHPIFPQAAVSNANLSRSLDHHQQRRKH